VSSKLRVLNDRGMLALLPALTGSSNRAGRLTMTSTNIGASMRAIPSKQASLRTDQRRFNRPDMRILVN
jgi:hypothetical protein